MPAWKARRVASRAIDLCPEGAAYVDRHLGLFAHRVSLAKLDTLVDEARARFNPSEAEQLVEQAQERRHVTIEDYQVSFDGTIQITAELDLADAMALQQAVTEGAKALKDAGSEESLDARRAIALGDLARAGFRDGRFATSSTTVDLYVHISQTALSDGGSGEAQFARLECPERLLLASQVAAWCGRPDAKITVKPVIDLNASISTTAYEVPARLREQVTLRDGTCVFPFCTRTARKADMDHVVPYDHDNPDQGGRTASENIVSMCRRHHRVKTHTRWRSEMPSPGVVIWTSPHGHRFRRDHTGTVPLGRSAPREPRPRPAPPPRYRGGGHLELVTGPPGEDPEQDARDLRRHGVDPITFEELLKPTRPDPWGLSPTDDEPPF